MIGMILCGHGNFASGMYSSLRLIAGEQEKIAVIDFTEGMSSERLGDLLAENVTSVDSGSGVIIFTDISGGTPFNQGAFISSKNESVKIIGGISLPLLLDSIFKRDLSLVELVNGALRAGKEGVKIFEEKVQQEVNKELGGI